MMNFNPVDVIVNADDTLTIYTLEQSLTISVEQGHMISMMLKELNINT